MFHLCVYVGSLTPLNVIRVCVYVAIHSVLGCYGSYCSVVSQYVDGSDSIGQIISTQRTTTRIGRPL